MCLGHIWIPYNHICVIYCLLFILHLPGWILRSWFFTRSISSHSFNTTKRFRTQKQGILKQLLCDDCMRAVSLDTWSGSAVTCMNILVWLNAKLHFQKQPRNSGFKLVQKANQLQSSEHYHNFGNLYFWSSLLPWEIWTLLLFFYKIEFLALSCKKFRELKGIIY